MDKVIHKISLPYRSSNTFIVPQDAEIVHIGQDPGEPMHAGIWYVTADIPEIDRDAIDIKRWDLASIYTGEAFNTYSAYLGTFVDRGYVHHLVRINTQPGMNPRY